MTRKLYQDGDVLYAQDVNAIAYPIPDGQDFIGRGPKVIDDYLSDGSNQIKARFYNFYDRLKVSHQTGLTFSYLGGVVLLGNGTLASINPGTINLTNNATSFVFVGSNGTVQQSSNLPNECFPLALITTANGTLSTLVDLRDKVIDRVTPSTIPVQQLIPPGVCVEYHGATLPSGWLWMDGAIYSQSTYPALYAALGPSSDAGGGNFRVPDHRGRVGVGAGQGTGLTNRILGQTFGEEDVALTTSQIPSHSHGINDPGHNHSLNDPGHNHGVNDPGHSHSLTPYRAYAEGNGTRGDGAELTEVQGGSNRYPNTAAATTGLTVNGAKTNLSINTTTTGITINSQGGGAAHNNVQPSIVCNFIIKT